MKSKEDGPLKQLTGKVRQFHQHVDAPIRQKPTLLPSDGDEAAEAAGELSFMVSRYQADGRKHSEFLTRLLLAIEELGEWCQAHANQDQAAAMDAWGDRIYVLLGDAVAAGLPADEIFQEVHPSNMSKVAGSTSDAGKGIKDASFQPPKLDDLLGGDSN